MKKMKKIKRIGAILLIFLLNINAFATSISANDGSAFITKAEFDALKTSFQAQINSYNNAIDSKIDNAIAGYLNGISVGKEMELQCLLSNLNSSRRTFVGKINNPNTNTQSNLKITTNGFWGTSTVNEGLDRSWGNSLAHGYMFIGFNNYQGGHGKGPAEKDNGQNGQFCLIDKDTINNQDFYYLRDKQMKKPTVKIFSWFAGVDYGIDYGKWSNKADVQNITWTNNGQWTGTNSRPVGKNKSGTTQFVTALENITLMIANGSDMTWTEQSCGDIVGSGNCGCLTKDDQFNWTYKMENQHYGNAGAQCYTSSTDPNRCDQGYIEGTTVHNSYNGGSEYFNLTFYVPKITSLLFSSLCQKDVSILSGRPTNYFNGLPLCNVTKQGKIKIKFQLKRSNTAGVVDVAIAREPFKNYTITSDSSTDIIYRNTIATSDTRWGGTTGTFEVEIDEDKTIDAVGKTLWMKCYCHNGPTAYNVELNGEEIIQTY